MSELICIGGSNDGSLSLAFEGDVWVYRPDMPREPVTDQNSAMHEMMAVVGREEHYHREIIRCHVRNVGAFTSEFREVQFLRFAELSLAEAQRDLKICRGRG